MGNTKSNEQMQSKSVCEKIKDVPRTVYNSFKDCKRDLQKYGQIMNVMAIVPTALYAWNRDEIEGLIHLIKMTQPLLSRPEEVNTNANSRDIGSQILMEQMVPVTDTDEDDEREIPDAVANPTDDPIEEMEQEQEQEESASVFVYSYEEKDAGSRLKYAEGREIKEKPDFLPDPGPDVEVGMVMDTHGHGNGHIHDAEYDKLEYGMVIDTSGTIESNEVDAMICTDDDEDRGNEAVGFYLGKQDVDKTERQNVNGCGIDDDSKCQQEFERFLAASIPIGIDKYLDRFKENEVNDIRYIHIFDEVLINDIKMNGIHKKLFMKRVNEYRKDYNKFENALDELKMKEKYHNLMENKGIATLWSYYHHIRSINDIVINLIINEKDALVIWNKFKTYNEYEQVEGK